MAQRNTDLQEQLPIETVAERIQSILINAAEGRRSVSDDRQYSNLRRTLLKEWSDVPVMVVTHPSVDSFSAFIRGIVDRGARVSRIREAFNPLFQELENSSASDANSSSWTGIEEPSAKARAVKNLLPLARAGIEGLIASLSEPNPNGGPLLAEHEEAVQNLRELHRALGDMLAAVDSGVLDDKLGEGLAAEIARYAKRAARALSRDPIPYVASGLLLGILTVCGIPGIGGYLSGVALNIRKNGSGDYQD